MRSDAADRQDINGLPPLHPGEVLREEFMEPHGVSAGAVAKACRVPRTRIERVAREELGISPDTAVRLGLYFGTSTEFWLNLQARYDARRAAVELPDLVKIITPIGRAAA